MKRFLWLMAGVFGAFGLVLVWRYQPKAAVVGQKVAVGTEATPSPDALIATPRPTPVAGTGPSPAPQSTAGSTPAPVSAGKPGATPKPTAAPTASPTSTPTPRGPYNDGAFKGQIYQAAGNYGPVQVQVVVSGGYITNVLFLQMPGPDSESKQVTAMAKPVLLQETLSAQSASVNTVSGATQTSQAYKSSLASALSKA